MILQSRRARWLLSSAAVAVSMAVPATYAWLSPRAGTIDAYRIGSLVMLMCGVAAIVFWPSPPEESDLTPVGRWRIGLGIAAAGACAIWLSSRLIPAIFAGLPDPNRGDMLLIIESGAREFIAGRMPYRMFQVPWDAPLSYGPALWMPFVIPILARADLRTLTLAAYVFVPAVCLVAAAFGLARQRWIEAACLALLAIAFAAQPQILAFYPIAHTPVYWPLLVLFCVLLALDRWTAAAAVLGLLICARTTMAALAPILLVAAYRRRRLTPGLVLWLALTSIGPFIPFLVKDPAAVRYGMFGVYVKTIKGFVWPQPTVIHTYGLTGLLLAHHLNDYVDAAQWLCLAIVYGASWKRLATARPEPWMALALLVFSMTTWWPVIYVYFDVWILMIGGLLAMYRVPFASGRRAVLALGASAAVAIAAVLAAGAWSPGSSIVVDVGTPAAAPLTGAGFGADEPSYDGNRNFVWVADTIARVRLPRAGWTGADIAIDIEPYGARAGVRQTVAASLNGKSIGVTSLSPGWQTITFHAPRPDWNYGFNVLSMYFGYALEDQASGRRLSAGIDRIVVR